MRINASRAWSSYLWKLPFLNITPRKLSVTIMTFLKRDTTYTRMYALTGIWISCLTLMRSASKVHMSVDQYNDLCINVK